MLCGYTRILDISEDIFHAIHF